MFSFLFCLAYAQNWINANINRVSQTLVVSYPSSILPQVTKDNFNTAKLKYSSLGKRYTFYSIYWESLTANTRDQLQQFFLFWVFQSIGISVKAADVEEKPFLAKTSGWPFRGTLKMKIKCLRNKSFTSDWNGWVKMVDEINLVKDTSRFQQSWMLYLAIFPQSLPESSHIRHPLWLV